MKIIRTLSALYFLAALSSTNAAEIQPEIQQLDVYLSSPRLSGDGLTLVGDTWGFPYPGGKYSSFPALWRAGKSKTFLELRNYGLHGISSDGSVVLASTWSVTNPVPVLLLPEKYPSLEIGTKLLDAIASDSSAFPVALSGDGAWVTGTGTPNIPLVWSANYGLPAVTPTVRICGTRSDGSKLPGSIDYISARGEVMLGKCDGKLYQWYTLSHKEKFFSSQIWPEVMSADGQWTAGKTPENKLARLNIKNDTLQYLDQNISQNGKIYAISSDGNIVLGLNENGRFYWSAQMGVLAFDDLLNRTFNARKNDTLSQWKNLSAETMSADGLTFAGSGLFTATNTYQSFLATIPPISNLALALSNDLPGSAQSPKEVSGANLFNVQFTVHNRGPMAASNVRVAAQIPEHLQPQPNGDCTLDSQNPLSLVCTFGKLELEQKLTKTVAMLPVKDGLARITAQAMSESVVIASDDQDKALHQINVLKTPGSVGFWQSSLAATADADKELSLKIVRSQSNGVLSFRLRVLPDSSPAGTPPYYEPFPDQFTVAEGNTQFIVPLAIHRFTDVQRKLVLALEPITLGAQLGEPALLTITLNPGQENHSPVIANPSQSLMIDHSLQNYDGKIAVSDQDKGDILTFTWITRPTDFGLKGTVDGGYTITPSGQCKSTAPDISYSVSDGLNVVFGKLTVQFINPNTPATPSQHVHRIEPIADRPVSLTLNGDDKDTGDTETLAFLLEGQLPTSFGTLKFTPAASGAVEKSYTFTPNAQFTGDAVVAFNYRAQDRCGGKSEVGRVVVIPKQAPVVIASAFSTPMNTSLAERIHARNENYLKDIRFTLKAAPQHGTLSEINPQTGSFVYQPTPDFIGLDSFTVTVTDGELVQDGQITVRVGGIKAVNTAGKTVRLGESLSFALADPENVPTGAAITYVLEDSKNPDKNLTLTPKTNALGYVTFKPTKAGTYTYFYHVEVNGQPSNTASVTFTVSAPTIEDIRQTCWQADATQPKPCGLAFATNSTSDIEIFTRPKHGTVTPVNGIPGQYTYLPDTEALSQGDYSDSFQIRDKNSGATATAHLEIKIKVEDSTGGDKGNDETKESGGGGSFDGLLLGLLGLLILGTRKISS